MIQTTAAVAAAAVPAADRTAPREDPGSPHSPQALVGVLPSTSRAGVREAVAAEAVAGTDELRSSNS